MHSTLKPENPFNSSHYIGLHAHALHVEDFIYILNLIRSDFFLMSLQLILMLTEKYVMADLRN